ncbi:MAG: ISAs1 family transposase [Blastocatellia bacterium]
MVAPEKVSANSLETLIECFADLPDPRIDRCKKHQLLDIVVIGLCAVICGAEGPSEMQAYGETKKQWLKQHLDLRSGIPSHDTFGRVLSLIEPRAFERCLLNWVSKRVELSDGEVVALDGKTLRRSHNRTAEQEAIEIVSAWAVGARLTLGQRRVDQHSNEITAVPKVLEMLNIEGCVVTVDALNCQKTIAAEIREKKADYVLALKDNHKHLREQVAEFLTTVREDRTVNLQFGTFQTVDGEHGRIETRRYWQAMAMDFLPEKAAWRDLTSVGMVEATREINGQATTELRYYLSSLPVDVEKFAHAVRSHWGIENSCHWVLDVVFREDDCRIRVGNAAENMSALRRFALNLLRRDKSEKRGVKIKRLKAALDDAYLLKILTS